MSFGYLRGPLAVTSLVLCACVGLVSCGQKSELYVPAQNGAKESLLERKNVKSQYIFGSTVPPMTTVPAPVETQPLKAGDL